MPAQIRRTTARNAHRERSFPVQWDDALRRGRRRA